LRTYEKVALAVLASTACVAAAARPAWAAPMDPTPDRLYLDNPGLKGSNLTCQQVAQNPNLVLTNQALKGNEPNAYPCLPNNVAWAHMMYELGHAIAPTAFHPARTTGFGGFALSLEAS
jgi:hypothetical protein